MALYTNTDYTRLTLVENTQASYRSEFRRDYDRILHTPAFRRLQGKTQVFPHDQSDFFRTRLTHSLEVAQIATSIGARLNSIHPFFRDHPIDLDLLNAAALAHDIGHPPFGHNGEFALNECMETAGGFEGNAQSFRIVARLARRREDSEYIDPPLRDRDSRGGLNLTARTLAAILKYDLEIDYNREGRKPLQKGYYKTEAGVVKWVKHALLGTYNKPIRRFKTLECYILEIADDIAYSAFDLEDALNGGFLDPLRILAKPSEFYASLATAINKSMQEERELQGKRWDEVTSDQLRKVVYGWFENIFDVSTDDPEEPLNKLEGIDDEEIEWGALLKAVGPPLVPRVYNVSSTMASNGYMRSALISDLLKKSILSIDRTDVVLNDECPALSVVEVNDNVRIMIECMKRLTFESVIRTPRIQQTRFMGRRVVRDIMGALSPEGSTNWMELLPDDYKEAIEGCTDKELKRRVVCDYVAGMTDKFALRFYRRLIGEDRESIFSPT